MSLHQVSRFADVREDRGLEVKIDDTSILLLRSGDQVRAFQGKCPHAGAPLAKGAVCHGQISLPWHTAPLASGAPACGHLPWNCLLYTSDAADE